jgi:hypothetical protein
MSTHKGGISGCAGKHSNESQLPMSICSGYFSRGTKLKYSECQKLHETIS